MSSWDEDEAAASAAEAATTDVELLKRAWRNEKAAPEILRFDSPLVSRVREQIQLLVCPFLLSVANPSSLDFFAALKYLIHSLGMMRIHSCDAARRRHWMTLLTAVSMTWWSLSTRWTLIARSSFCAPTSVSACRRLVASEPNLCSLKQANCNY